MSDDKTLIEKIANNPLTMGGMALVAAKYPELAPAALLPVLMSSLGFIEYEDRIKSCLAEINAGHEKQRDHIRRFSSVQMRMTVGIIQTIYSTGEAEKLRMLKAAALNIAGSDYLEHHQAQEFHRILRDASAADIDFLVRHRTVKGFNFHQGNQQNREGIISIRQDNPDNALARNLITLGLLVRSPGEGTAGDDGAYLVAPQVPQLLKLLEDTPIEEPPDTGS